MLTKSEQQSIKNPSSKKRYEKRTVKKSIENFLVYSGDAF